MPDALTKYYEAALQEGPCAPSEAIGLITTNRVDADREVVLPGGGDFTDYRRNPLVMWGHARGVPSEGEQGMPVGKNLWIKPTRDGNGLVAKHAFDTDDAFAARVCGKVKRGVLTCYSITFRPLEFGPPTKEEVAAHPAWKDARTVYRRWKLLEYSVVALPANVDAVTLAKRDTAMSAAETPPEDAADGRDPTDEAARPEAPAAPAPDEAPPPAVPDAAPVSKAGDGAVDEDDDEPAEEPPPFKRGDHVKCRAPHCKGCGTVVSVHKGEMVPEVDEDLYGTPDAPAARVKMCKRKDGACVPTALHKGLLCKHLDFSEPTKAPKRKAADPAPPPEPAGWTDTQTAVYLQSRIADPTFEGLVMDRLRSAIEVKVLGKV